MRKSYSIEDMQCITFFEDVTKVSVKDVIRSELSCVFIVDEGMTGKAVGQSGKLAKRLEDGLRKRVRIVGFSSELKQFIVNVVAPLQIAEFEEQDGIVTLTAKDLKTRGMLIGRNASHLREFEAIIQRHFAIRELRVQ